MASLDDNELQTYLDKLRETGSQVKARQAIRRKRKTIDDIRETDEAFREAEIDAMQEADDALEQEARRRAVEGVLVGKYHEGKLVDTELKYSDTLLIFMMKGAPTLQDRYAERSKSEITGRGGAPLVDETAAAARIASILEAARNRKEQSE